MARDYVILPDVTCDLNSEIRSKYGIEFINGHFAAPGGEERDSYLDWPEGVTNESFYADLKKDPNSFSTSPPNAYECADAYCKYLSEGKDIIAMSITSGMSGTLNFMKSAAESALLKYPEGKIYVVDSLRFGAGFGLLAINAAIMRNNGKTIEETYEWLLANRNRVHQMGWLDDLSFVAKKGRINHSKAFFGTLIGIKPIGDFSANGITSVLGKCKNEKNAYEVMLGYIEKTIENPSEQVILIAQSSRRKQAEIFAGMVNEKFHPAALHFCDVFPSTGINIGPGLMAAYYLGAPITEDLEKEKEIFASLAAK